MKPATLTLAGVIAIGVSIILFIIGRIIEHPVYSDITGTTTGPSRIAGALLLFILASLIFLGGLASIVLAFVQKKQQKGEQ